LKEDDPEAMVELIDQLHTAAIDLPDNDIRSILLNDCIIYHSSEWKKFRRRL
jgi:hypothetical protein